MNNKVNANNGHSSVHKRLSWASAYLSYSGPWSEKSQNYVLDINYKIVQSSIHDQQQTKLKNVLFDLSTGSEVSPILISDRLRLLSLISSSFRHTNEGGDINIGPKSQKSDKNTEWHQRISIVFHRKKYLKVFATPHNPWLLSEINAPRPEPASL